MKTDLEINAIVQETFELLKTKGLTYYECGDILHEVKNLCAEQVNHKYEEARNIIIK